MSLKPKNAYYAMDGNQRYFLKKLYYTDRVLDNPSSEHICLNCDQSFGHKVREECIWCKNYDQYQEFNHTCYKWTENKDGSILTYLKFYHNLCNASSNEYNQLSAQKEMFSYSSQESKEKRIIIKE